ncbi:MAG: hypothetical protein L0Y80_11540 [Ignavibacteriae bacterium]|nr:hypothetical protein [Ignavibacteriota bacterium]
MKQSSPNQQLQVSPLDEWTEPEKWVWEQVSRSKVADFNAKHSKKLDPRKPEGWTDERLVSPEFIETILLTESFKNIIPRQGFWILGALIKKLWTYPLLT